MTNNKNKEATIYVGGQVPISVHDFLFKVACKEDKSLSAIVRTALSQYVENLRKQACV